jgi:hypothetical protein
MLILEVVHFVIKYTLHRDVFILEFLDVINLAEVKLFHFYTNPFSSVDDFTKLLQQSNDVLLVQWCSYLVEPQAFLGYNVGGQIFVVHIRNLVDGCRMRVHEKDFSKATIVVNNCFSLNPNLNL